MLPRIVLFALHTTGVWLADAWFQARVEPQQSASLAIAAVNGGNRDAADLRLHDAVKDEFILVPWVLTIALFVLCFGNVIARGAREVVR